MEEVHSSNEDISRDNLKDATCDVIETSETLNEATSENAKLENDEDEATEEIKSTGIEGSVKLNEDFPPENINHGRTTITELPIESSETYIGTNGTNAPHNGFSQGDAVGSRLAAPTVTAGSQSPNDPNRSPVYNPNNNLAKSSKNVKLGFGHTPQAKLSNITIHDFQNAASGKAEQVRSWSVRAFKCTKQVLSEKLGKAQRTVDIELEAKIEILKDTKRTYENLLYLARMLSKHFSSIVATQQALSAAFAELSSKSQELQDEFRYNAEAQIVIAKNGESLISAIDAFVIGVETLCTKTMEDTLLTVGKYETARLTYDAYKNELTSLNLRSRTSSMITKQAAAQARFEMNKVAYERLRDDVAVKLRFLDENRVKVMQKNLLLFHRSITAYFSGNQEELAEALQQFHVTRVGSDVVISKDGE